MIDTYLFDLYGTLVDIRTDESMPRLWARMALYFSMQGAAYGPEELHAAYISAVAEAADQRSKERPNVIKAHIEPEIRSAFSALYAGKGVPVNEQIIEDTALIFRTLSLRHIRLYPKAARVLRTLRERGSGVYLLSNAQSVFTMPELRKLGLLPLFDGIVLSSDAGVKKPDKAIFEHILSKYDLRPEECLMIGNDGEADILGAAGVGICSRYIHTKQSPPRPEKLPDTCREISSLQELL